MSIWATTLDYDTGEWGGDSSPYAYRGSHLWPDPADRGGSFSLGAIPGYVTHHGQALDETGERVWPWLRVSVVGAGDDENRDTVLLRAEQVRQLRDELTRWLAQTETP